MPDNVAWKFTIDRPNAVVVKDSKKCDWVHVVMTVREL